MLDVAKGFGGRILLPCSNMCLAGKKQNKTKLFPSIFTFLKPSHSMCLCTKPQKVIFARMHKLVQCKIRFTDLKRERHESLQSVRKVFFILHFCIIKTIGRTVSILAMHHRCSSNSFKIIESYATEKST